VAPSDLSPFLNTVVPPVFKLFFISTSPEPKYQKKRETPKQTKKYTRNATRLNTKKECDPPNSCLVHEQRFPEAPKIPSALNKRTLIQVQNARRPINLSFIFLGNIQIYWLQQNKSTTNIKYIIKFRFLSGKKHKPEAKENLISELHFQNGNSTFKKFIFFFCNIQNYWLQEQKA